MVCLRIINPVVWEIRVEETSLIVVHPADADPWRAVHLVVTAYLKGRIFQARVDELVE